MALYGQWANNRLFQAIQSVPASLYHQNCDLPYHSIHGTLNHLIAANQLWQFRLTGTGNIPPSLTHIFHKQFEEVAESLKNMDVFWIDFLCNQSASWLDDESAFTLQDGRSFHFPNQLLLAHFWNHQSLIRGQLQTVLQQQKVPCLPLEMITYLMENGLSK
ncbi:MAG: hypothetical protein IPP67_04990 [Rhodospirillaceae bacterium]|nr:hypothetical protein [Rhodospirillaceae bacterium]